MFEDRPMVKVGPKIQGKTFRIFPVSHNGQRSLPDDVKYDVLKDVIARFGRGWVKRVFLNDYLPPTFTPAELANVKGAAS